MAVSNRDQIGRGLALVLDGLRPFVDRHLGPDWLSKHEEQERRAGRPATVSDSDPRLLLRKINDDWRVFKDSLSSGDRARSQEIRDLANKFSHNFESRAFADRETVRGLETMVMLLQAIGAVSEAEQLEKLYAEQHQAAMARAARRAAKQQAALPAVAGMGLKPWREVIRPHHDVASGNFNAAEFAANLHRVAHGEVGGEYGDPVEFFQRTYLTEGLRDLLRPGIARICGDENAAPVVNLQTNFGGGKTHSLLALYHLCSGTPLSAYPQEVQELLDGVDLGAVGHEVRRVTIVGNHFSANDGSRKADGTHVRTMWGEMAWQLGGRPAYDSIAEADRTSSSPADALTELIAAHSPCLILIDEWVAYARELLQPDLVGGSFDTQFSFAQTLTEAVASVRGALLVVSIPASDSGDDAGSAIEVGGPHGHAALRRLQNVIGRVAVPWRPASATESFEIVRRRLFEDPSPEARTDIGAVARRFTQFYGEHRAEFPSNTSEVAYEKRIRDAYPLHPELFDRLYEDWSTLERFQRTRGVLRLMSTVISTLWQANDPYPLIMPGTVPLNDDRVLTEVTQYLEDSWKSIIDADVDGNESTPAQIDRQNSALYGHRAVTRRLARAVFLGSAATLRSAHKGIDQNRVWLGTAVPGDVLPHFTSSLHRLADQATYLYADTSRYWYDTQRSITRIAKDRADRLREQPDEVDAEITSRLQAFRRRPTGDFAAAHPTPDNSADILDSDEARLVLLHPRHVHRNRESNSPALEFARTALANRGGSPRRHRNMLVFLAADDRRKEELDEAVREFLSWGYIVDRATELDLSPNQQQMASTRRKKADDVISQRIGTTYIWVIMPEQPDSRAPAELRPIRVEGQSAELVERVSDRLRREGALAAMHAPQNIRQYLDGPLASIWNGHISVGDLWQHYTAHPYLPRLRDRAVLDDGVLAVLGSFTWEIDGFALASGYVETTGRYIGLVIPHQDSLGFVTDAVLLVDPEAALRQRREDTYSEQASADGNDVVVTETSQGAFTLTGDPIGTPAPPSTYTRFFGVVEIDSQRYGREFTRLQQEIIAHLVATEASSVRITVELDATRPDGFGDDTVRTVSENARVLRFDRADFE